MALSALVWETAAHQSLTQAPSSPSLLELLLPPISSGSFIPCILYFQPLLCSGARLLVLALVTASHASSFLPNFTSCPSPIIIPAFALPWVQSEEGSDVRRILISDPLSSLILPFFLPLPFHRHRSIPRWLQFRLRRLLSPRLQPWHPLCTHLWHRSRHLLS